VAAAAPVVEHGDLRGRIGPAKPVAISWGSHGHGGTARVTDDRVGLVGVAAQVGADEPAKSDGPTADRGSVRSRAGRRR
jgi:hypothetical protein